MADLNDQRADANECMIELEEPSAVGVVVGTERRTFFVHEGVLDREGTFFYSALRKCWVEGKHRCIELPTDDPESFKVYAHWLYTNKLFVKEPDESQDFPLLINLYILGEKILDREFQDCVTDALHAATKDPAMDPEMGEVRVCPGQGEPVDMLYRNTPKGDPMRRLLVSLFVYNGHKDWIEDAEDWIEKVNHEFLADVAIALYKVRDEAGFPEQLQELDRAPLCFYHHHGSDEPCTGWRHRQRTGATGDSWADA